MILMLKISYRNKVWNKLGSLEITRARKKTNKKKTTEKKSANMEPNHESTILYAFIKFITDIHGSVS